MKCESQWCLSEGQVRNFLTYLRLFKTKEPGELCIIYVMINCLTYLVFGCDLPRGGVQRTGPWLKTRRRRRRRRRRSTDLILVQVEVESTTWVLRSVGTRYLCTTLRPTWVVKSLKPHVPLSGENQTLQNVTEVWKPPRDTSFNSYWSLWAPWPVRSPVQYNACSHSLLSLLYNPSEGRRLSRLFLHRRGKKHGFSSSHLLFPSNSSWRRVAASSSSHQGNLLASQALPTS